MPDFPKYKMLERVVPDHRKWPDRVLTKAPVWASVDLRDGNQALPIPMDPDRKLQYFRMLTGIGFKEIEVSFPSASQDDFAFTRRLIEEELIPDDVRISVLTQSREHLIRRTVESIQGVKRAIQARAAIMARLRSARLRPGARRSAMRRASGGTASPTTATAEPMRPKLASGRPMSR